MKVVYMLIEMFYDNLGRKGCPHSFRFDMKVRQWISKKLKMKGC